VKRAVSGNLCRCGAYANIVAAGVSASRALAHKEKTGAKAR
jgi:aerobic-type carbon monoxide dehydrogenase small subunit (CoxS/CutS family)